jgi:hypothetical protein
MFHSGVYEDLTKAAEGDTTENYILSVDEKMARGSVVVKAPRYRPKGRVFETR